MSFDVTREIETERLLIRPPKASDASAMLSNWASDPEVTKYLAWKPYESVGEAEAFIAMELAWDTVGNLRNWFIELKSTGEVIGSIGFAREDPETGTLYVEFALGRRWWGREIMPEALRAVLRRAFDWLGAKRIVLQHDAADPKIGRVAEKCCMVYEGLMRRAAVNNRGVVDICQYAILAHDYEDAYAPRNNGESVWQAWRSAGVIRLVREQLRGSHIYAPGTQIAVSDETISIPPKGVRNAFSNIGFAITLHWSCLEPLARAWLLIRTAPVLLDSWAAEEAITRLGTDSLEWREDSFESGFFQVRMPFGGLIYEGLAREISWRCELLDAAVVETRIVELEGGRVGEFEQFDIEGCLVDMCFDDEFAAQQARAFRERYPDPAQQLRAAYTLPYNLDMILDESLADFIEGEASQHAFAFAPLVNRRLDCLGQVIAALERKWFSLSQIAFIVCRDTCLFELVSTSLGADEFCQQLENSRFDPTNVDHWGSYASCEGGCLVDYL